MSDTDETTKTKEKFQSFDFYISQLKQNTRFISNYQSIYKIKKQENNTDEADLILNEFHSFQIQEIKMNKIQIIKNTSKQKML